MQFAMQGTTFAGINYDKLIHNELNQIIHCCTDSRQGFEAGLRLTGYKSGFKYMIVCVSIPDPGPEPEYRLFSYKNL